MDLFNRLTLSALMCAGLALGARAGERDFNGDGFDDLAIGVEETVGGFDFAGAVHVLDGSAAGLTGDGSRFFHQNKSGFDDAAEFDDDFCSATAIGDFDGDGFADLAIGVKGETLNEGTEGEVVDTGVVHVLYGAANGLRGTGSQFLHQDVDGVEDVAEENDSFGNRLATGDFDGDGFDDLAISVIGQDVNGQGAAGAIHVFYGSNAGLTVDRDEVWHRDVAGVRGTAVLGNFFGLTLTSGDFNGDGADDLAAGCVDNVGGALSAGSFSVLYGTLSVGLTADNDQLFTQDSAGILDQAETQDRFGALLSAGDFDGDGIDDLAVGASFEDIEESPSGLQTGAVHIIYGTDNGLRATNNQLFHLDSPGVPGIMQGGDIFGGEAIFAADFNGDGRDDLAIGSSNQDVNGDSAAGVVIILYGDGGGLGTEGARLFHQDSAGVPGEAREDDDFGVALSAGDFNGDGFDDLAVGAGGETVQGQFSAGAVNILYGTAEGLRGAGAQLFSQATAGIADSPASNVDFGVVLPNR